MEGANDETVNICEFWFKSFHPIIIDSSPLHRSKDINAASNYFIRY